MIREPLAQPLITTRKTNWTSILQLVFSVWVFIVCISTAVLMSVSEIRNSHELSPQSPQAGAGLGLVVVSLGLSFVALVSIVSSIRGLAGKKKAAEFAKNWKFPVWNLVFFVALLVVVMLSGENSSFSQHVRTIFILPGVVLPILWLLKIGFRNLWGDNLQRDSGILTFSMAFTTFLIILMEILAVVLLLMLLGLVLARDPEFIQTIQRLADQFLSTNGDPQKILNTILPILQKPAVITMSVVIIAVVVPLIEEALKTLGVWLLPGKELTPVEGFATGLLCGAGFAMAEGLLSGTQIVGSSPGQWVILILGRFAGSLLHIFNGGLSGWAIVRTREDKRLWRLIGIYFLTVIVHGLWNGFAALGGLIPLLRDATQDDTVDLFAIPLILIFIVLLSLFLVITKKIHTRYGHTG